MIESAPAGMYQHLLSDCQSELRPIPSDIPLGYIEVDGTLHPWFQLDEIEPELAREIFANPDADTIQTFHIYYLLHLEGKEDYANRKLFVILCESLNSYIDKHGQAALVCGQTHFALSEKFLHDLQTGALDQRPELPLSLEDKLWAVKAIIFHELENYRTYLNLNPKANFSEYKSLIPAVWHLKQLSESSYDDEATPVATMSELDELYNKIDIILAAIDEYKGLGDKITQAYFGDSPSQPVGPRPRIKATDTDLRSVTKRAWTAIRRYNYPARIFTYAGKIARISLTGGSAAIELLKRDHIRNELIDAADWYKMAKSKEAGAYPYDYVCNNLLADRNPPLPTLLGLTFAPTFAKNGRLHKEPGYSSYTGLYYIEQPDLRAFPAIPGAHQKGPIFANSKGAACCAAFCTGQLRRQSGQRRV